MNSLFVIAPYRYLGMWVFDDPRVGLVQEPFVGGTDAIIDQLTASIPDAEKGFRLIFSSVPFPDHQVRFVWLRAEMSGNVYRAEPLEAEGWLCPALLKYFDEPPAEIYAKFEPLAQVHSN
ncbi:MAG: hypothetical protein JSS66_12585 [Armatimonadetes bacterium]|nr:hypothetical protein [Armatimonadota bacterium]